MRVVKKEVSAVALTSIDRHILLGQKSADSPGPYAGLWVLPGGVKRNDENSYVAACRETKAEVGIDIADHRTFLIDDDVEDQTPVMLTTGERIIYQMRFSRFHTQINKLASEVEVSESEELTKPIWVPALELPNYEHAPPSISLFRKIGLWPKN